MILGIYGPLGVYSQVVDPPVNQPPVINLLGDNPLSLQRGSPYVEPGFTVTDDFDSNLELDVEITGQVDNNQVGIYFLSYNVTDSGGLSAQEVVRTVSVSDFVTTPNFLKNSRLILRKSVSIYRRGPGEGYIDPQTRSWVQAEKATPFEIKAGVVPYRDGKTQSYLPEGITVKDALVLYTAHELFTADEYLEREADEVEIDGRPYVVFFVEDWTTFNLTTSHFRCTILLKDKLRGIP